MPYADPGPASRLSGVHERFARTALSLFGLVGTIGALLLLSSSLADMRGIRHRQQGRLEQQAQLRAWVLEDLITDVRSELQRLSERHELDLEDQDAAPEIALLDMSHDGGPLFDLGLVLLDEHLHVVSYEPSNEGVPQWLERVLSTHAPIDSVLLLPSKAGELLVLTRPLLRGERQTGLLLGAIQVSEDPALISSDTVLWQLRDPADEPGHDDDGNVRVLLPLHDLPLVLEGTADIERMLAPVRKQVWWRLGLWLSLLAALMVVMFRRLQSSLVTFREAETEALQDAHLRLLGTAIDSIAHEIRNATNGLRLGIDLLPASQTEPDTRVRRQIQEQILRMNDLSLALMHFADDDLGRTQPVALQALLEETIGSGLGLLADELGVEIRLVADGALQVDGNPTLLRMVFGNLVRNALDSLAGRGEPGGHVQIEVSRLDDKAVVVVADDGDGVAEEVATRLFEPFVSGRRSGVGVGLALVSRMAAAHGGQAHWLGHGPLGGAAFEVVLPLVQRMDP